MPETIKVRADQLPISIELEPPPLPPPPPTPQVRVKVDRTRTVINQLEQGVALVTNEWLWGPKASAVEAALPHVQKLYKQVSFHLSGGFGVGDSWEWNPATGPKPTAPKIHPTVKLMANLAGRFGNSPLLTAYRPSWHQKRERGTPLTYADAWLNEKGRLSGEYKEEWRLMLSELVFTVATETLLNEPEATFDVEVHNEFKGMWQLLLKDKVLRGQNWADGENPGTPGYGDIDYGPYYGLCVQACLEGFARAGVGRDRVRFGGPYAVMQSEGNRDANALPVGHPLADRPWGTMSKAPIYAIQRFLAYVKKYGLPLDYLVVDGGTNNRDQVYHTDVWGQLKKVSEANLYLRFMLDEAGFYRTPIWWAERYLTERALPGATRITPYQDSMPRRAAVLAAGLCEMAYSGAGRIFQWGLRGEDGDPYFDDANKENAAYFTAQGQPTLLYETCLAFEQTFPKGCCLHPLIIEGEGVAGLGSCDAMILYNQTNEPKLVEAFDNLWQLAPDEVLSVVR